MRWLITGGCGFVGTSLVHALAIEGKHHVRVIDNLVTGTRDDLTRVTGFTVLRPGDIGPMDKAAGSMVELIEGDVVDGPLMFKAAAGADAIVHLAAANGAETPMEDPALDCTVNVFGTLNALEAARHNRVQRFVFASSRASIGECESPVHEELAPRPVSPFGASKLAGEAYCSAYYWSFGIDAIALRFGNVYGPGSHHATGVVARLIRDAMAGRRLDIRGDGQQTRDLIYIDDLVRAVRLAATAVDVGGETFQIATGAETSMDELVEKLLPALATAGMPPAVIRHAAPRVGNVERSYSDTAKALRLLGWKAEIKLAEGLRRTVAWHVGRTGARTRSALA